MCSSVTFAAGLSLPKQQKQSCICYPRQVGVWQNLHHCYGSTRGMQSAQWERHCHSQVQNMYVSVCLCVCVCVCVCVPAKVSVSMHMHAPTYSEHRCDYVGSMLQVSQHNTRSAR